MKPAMFEYILSAYNYTKALWEKGAGMMKLNERKAEGLNLLIKNAS